MSKVFVGTAVLCLVDDGVLSLDDTVSKYIEEVPNGDQITLRMLGHHQSGLFCPIDSLEFQQEVMADPKKLWQSGELISRSFAHRPYNRPGEAWHYSNTSAILLAVVAERATGKSIAEIVDAQVCQPLGLKSTGFCTAGSPPSPTPKAYRNGRKDRLLGFGDRFVDVTGYSASWAGAAGDMYSTAFDLGIAANPLATGQLLKPATRCELLNWQSTTWPGLEYGFFIGRTPRGIGHEGNVPGFQAIVCYQPAKHRSVVVLTNLSNNADGTGPAEQLIELLDSVRLEQWP